MVWVRFDDQFTIHRKVDGLSSDAFRLHVYAVFWCVRNLTDGFIPEEDLDIVCARVRTPTKLVAELVRRKLWEKADGGWLIHDFLTYQFSKDRVLADREKKAEAGRKGGLKSGESRRTSSNRRGSGSGSKNEAGASSSGSPLVEPPIPVPSSPEGTRTDTGSQSVLRRNARGNDDDSIDLAIVQLLAERTGREVSILWAAKLRQQILDGRDVRATARRSYVITAISERPHDFLPPVDPKTSEQSPVQAAPEWCGYCDAHDRRVELADGTVARCEMCNPLVRRSA